MKSAKKTRKNTLGSQQIRIPKKRQPKSEQAQSKEVVRHSCVDEGCRVMKGEKLSDAEFSDYLVKLVREVWDLIDAGVVDLDSAYIGYDMNSGADVWNYGQILAQLIKAGYCRKCADNFLASLAEVKNDNGSYANQIVMTKEFEKIIVL